MNKQAISVTLRAENLLWLRGQVRSSGARSVSEVLDGVVAAVRTGGSEPDGAVRSVKGSISIAADDPALLEADAVVRALFARSGRTSKLRRGGARARRSPTAAGRSG